MKLSYFMLCLLLWCSVKAQNTDSLPVFETKVVKRVFKGKPFELHVTEETKIFDKKTGKEITYDEYKQRQKDFPKGYFAEPIYDEYGSPSSFFLRETTEEERTQGRYRMLTDPLKPVAVGDAMPNFIMTDINGEEHSAANLKGKTVVLGLFPMANHFKEPYFKVEAYKSLVKQYLPKNVVFITVFFEEAEFERNGLEKELNTPIVINGRGFAIRFGLMGSSDRGFVVIDKEGKLMAYASTAPDLTELEAVLKKL